MKALVGTTAPRLSATSTESVAWLIAPAPAPLATPLVVGVLSGPGDEELALGVAVSLDESDAVLAEVRPVTVAAPYRGAAVDAIRLLEDGVRVIVAAFPARVLNRLAPLCRQYGAALVAVGTGSLEVSDPLDDGVVHVTEQRWDVAFELGDWSSRNLGGRLFQVVAATEAEYDVVDALARGFRGAGGEVAGSATTHDRAAGTGSDAAALAALVAGADTVAVHATAGAADIVRSLRRTCGDVSIVLDGPDAATVAELSRRYGAVFSASAVSAGCTAYDAGRLLVAGAALLAEQGLPWSRLADVLGGVTVEGACGPVTVDPLTHGTRSQVVVQRTAVGRPTVVARRAS